MITLKEKAGTTGRATLEIHKTFFPAAIGQSGTVFLAVLALILPGGPDVSAQGATNSQPKRVLMLFSESKDVPGNIMLEQAVRTEMQRASTNRIEFSSEYLDAGHYSDKEHFRVFQDYIGRKYAGQNLDLILAFPSQDYLLAGELPDALFPVVPVVFVAVNEQEVPPVIPPAFLSAQGSATKKGTPWNKPRRFRACPELAGSMNRPNFQLPAIGVVEAATDFVCASAGAILFTTFTPLTSS